MNLKRNNEYIKAFGENLRELRKKKGFSMEELAIQADVEYTQIAKIETGKINTTISTAYVIAEALGIDILDLFKFQFPPKDN